MCHQIAYFTQTRQLTARRALNASRIVSAGRGLSCSLRCLDHCGAPLLLYRPSYIPACAAFAVRAQIVFFFNDTATTEIYTLSLHDALPICVSQSINACS